MTRKIIFSALSVAVLSTMMFSANADARENGNFGLGASGYVKFFGKPTLKVDNQSTSSDTIDVNISKDTSLNKSVTAFGGGVEVLYYVTSQLATGLDLTFGSAGKMTFDASGNSLGSASTTGVAYLATDNGLNFLRFQSEPTNYRAVAKLEYYMLNDAFSPYVGLNLGADFGKVKVSNVKFNVSYGATASAKPSSDFKNAAFTLDKSAATTAATSIGGASTTSLNYNKTNFIYGLEGGISYNMGSCALKFGATFDRAGIIAPNNITATTDTTAFNALVATKNDVANLAAANASAEVTSIKSTNHNFGLKLGINVAM